MNKESMGEYLTSKSIEIFNNNKDVGWWDDPNRCVLEVCQLIITEVSEATEGERKDLMDDHIPSRKMGEVELADALIRTLDLCGAYHIQIEGEYLVHNHDVSPGCPIASNHFFVSRCVCAFGESVKKIACTPSDDRETQETEPFMCRNQKELAKLHAGVLVATIMEVARIKGYDIIAAMNEKIDYNKSRIDHKRSERQKQGGKKF